MLIEVTKRHFQQRADELNTEKRTQSVHCPHPADGLNADKGSFLMRHATVRHEIESETGHRTDMGDVPNELGSRRAERSKARSQCRSTLQSTKAADQSGTPMKRSVPYAYLSCCVPLHVLSVTNNIYFHSFPLLGEFSVALRP